MIISPLELLLLDGDEEISETFSMSTQDVEICLQKMKLIDGIDTARRDQHGDE